MHVGELEVSLQAAVASKKRKAPADAQDMATVEKQAAEIAALQKDKGALQKTIKKQAAEVAALKKAKAKMQKTIDDQRAQSKAAKKKPAAAKKAAEKKTSKKPVVDDDDSDEDDDCPVEKLLFDVHMYSSYESTGEWEDWEEYEFDEEPSLFMNHKMKSTTSRWFTLRGPLHYAERNPTDTEVNEAIHFGPGFDMKDGLQFNIDDNVFSDSSERGVLWHETVQNLYEGQKKEKGRGPYFCHWSSGPSDCYYAKFEIRKMRGKDSFQLRLLSAEIELEGRDDILARCD